MKRYVLTRRVEVTEILVFSAENDDEAKAWPTSHPSVVPERQVTNAEAWQIKDVWDYEGGTTND